MTANFPSNTLYWFRSLGLSVTLSNHRLLLIRILLFLFRVLHGCASVCDLQTGGWASGRVGLGLFGVSKAPGGELSMFYVIREHV